MYNSRKNLKNKKVMVKLLKYPLQMGPRIIFN